MYLFILYIAAWIRSESKSTLYQLVAPMHHFVLLPKEEEEVGTGKGENRAKKKKRQQGEGLLVLPWQLC